MVYSQKIGIPTGVFKLKADDKDRLTFQQGEVNLAYRELY